MPIIGIKSLVYGVEDVELSTRFFSDFGLPLIEGDDKNSTFQLEEGSSVVIRQLADPLRKRPSEAVLDANCNLEGEQAKLGGV
ncbi:hypothetical protein [Paraburkholderia haematera]|uniref:Glyoxalase n=1 Tax=Paraburkholderia haematera TaxID=2793077 RepID=A0ABM8R2G9_9BURK|nr:hypothetical protein [Paraburkholderia haematera]CAE6729334.1 hypothetical protein R69888_01977 [Paraburkholderia haematera]